MKTVTMDTAMKNLPQLISDTISNCEETLIVTEEGTVVMVNLKEWNNIQEHLLLLKDRRALKALFEVQETRKRGETPPGKSIEEVFNDL